MRGMRRSWNYAHADQRLETGKTIRPLGSDIFARSSPENGADEKSAMKKEFENRGLLQPAFAMSNPYWTSGAGPVGHNARTTPRRRMMPKRHMKNTFSTSVVGRGASMLSSSGGAAVLRSGRNSKNLTVKDPPKTPAPCERGHGIGRGRYSKARGSPWNWSAGARCQLVDLVRSRCSRHRHEAPLLHVYDRRRFPRNRINLLASRWGSTSSFE